MRLFVDFETRSACDLKEHGVARYYEDPTTQVICLGYAFGDEPASIIKLGEPIPASIIDHIAGGNEVVSHGEFDALIWNHVVRRDHPEYPEIKPEQIVDTSAQCRMACIPASLEKAGEYLKLTQQKQKVGKVLINKLSRPKTLSPLEWNEKPEVLEAMYDYCKQDVETCREINKTLPPLSDRERRVYALDYRINERGVLCDLEFARSGVRIAAEYKAGLDTRIREATNGQVTACSEVKKIGEWATANGLPIESVAKAELAETLAGAVPDNVRQVLEYRQDYAKTSTAKLVKLLDMVSADGRLRWQFRYHGTSTGRFSGRGVQLQNLPRIPYDDKDEARFLVNQIKAGADLLSRPLDKISSVLRGALIADGSFVGADFSAIECRVLAWLAWQKDVLEAFARREDPYCFAASQIYGRPITKADKAERAVGKVTILACGYQGHMGAFANMARVYGVKVPDETAKKVIVAWRQANGFIVRYWADVARAAFEALKTPGTNKTVGRPGCFSTFRADMRAGVSTLKIKLPSGRVLYYPNATAKEEWKYGKVGYSFEYDGQEEGKAVWGRLDSYGGKLVANITSATARDIMVDAMFRVDAQFPVVASVHDEVLSEGVQPDEPTFVELMSKSPDWAPDLPMAVEAWVGDRYLKG